MSQVPSGLPPLIVHVIFQLGIGGLENGLVNLVNHTPEDRFRHAIVCLKGATEFRGRLKPGVEVFELHRREGQDFAMYARLNRLLRRLRPTIAHTRNLAAVECQYIAWLAGVPIRIHGEHGWDVFDPKGENRKYQYLRRAVKPMVHRYIPLSRHLEQYLLEKIRVPPAKITRICNGVDTEIFFPRKGELPPLPGCPFAVDGESHPFRIGTIGRMHGVKNQLTLVRAYLRLREHWPRLSQNCRLVLVGDGPLRAEALALLESGGLARDAWLPGERNDIADLLRGLDLFVLPSLAEGISNTILEAMASGLPVIATGVGGNPELVQHGLTGTLVPSGDPEAMAAALAAYLEQPGLVAAHGLAGLHRARESFSLRGMVNHYLAVYQELLEQNH